MASSVNNRNGHKRPEIDRLPPYSEEAELAVLACVLMDANAVMPEVITKFRSSKAYFFDLRHQTIFDIMLAMFDKREPITVMTVIQRLKDLQILDEVGGLGYLSTLPDSAPSALNIGYYLKLVHGFFIRRQIIKIGMTISNLAYDFAGESNELLDKAERDVLAIRNHQATIQTQPIKELIKGNISAIEDYVNGAGKLPGLSTGFVDLDRLTTGMFGGELWIIAGRPSMGKSSLAGNIVEHQAVNLRNPSAFISLEMGASKVSMRMLCSRARVNIRSVKEGFLAERDYPKLTAAAGKISSSPLYIDDCPDKSLMRVRAQIRRYHQQHGIVMAIVDYLQLMDDSEKQKHETRQQEITKISKGMKSIAQELNIPIIVLSQLNRDVEREGRPPRLSDLRESGAIEQDADFVGMLWSPKKEDSDEDHTHVMPVNLYIAKQRDGEAGLDVHLTFIKSFTRFESAAKICDADVPVDAQKDLDYRASHPDP